MNTFRLTVASPDGNIFQGDAIGLFLRGAEGDLAILAGHTPFITAVMPGRIRIELPDGNDPDVFSGTADGGLLTVGADSVVLLVNSMKPEEA